MRIVGKLQDGSLDGSQESGECLVGSKGKAPLSFWHTTTVFADEINHRRIIRNAPQHIDARIIFCCHRLYFLFQYLYLGVKVMKIFHVGKFITLNSATLL